MKILFINNDGGGFADHIEIPHGTTVQELFERQMRHAKPENYLIRVNRQSASRDEVLVEGDRVTFTPAKIEGALAWRRVLRAAS
jgi:ThiS family